tara:strand:- start:3787 stop:4026 length:240 start_codon:yes stop_codon:yes gene_type:complete
MSDYNDFVPASDFNSWFEANKDMILAMVCRDDTPTIIYAAWLEGYSNGLDAMAKHRPLIPLNITDAEQKQLDKLDDSNV